MHIVCRISKATNTHFYLFYCYNGYKNAPQCYVPLHCLSCLHHVFGVANNIPSLRRLSVQHCTHIATDLSGTSFNVTTDLASCKSSCLSTSAVLCRHSIYTPVLCYCQVRALLCNVLLYLKCRVGNGRRRL
jgi:hypothetical protein